MREGDSGWQSERMLKGLSSFVWSLSRCSCPRNRSSAATPTCPSRMKKMSCWLMPTPDHFLPLQVIKLHVSTWNFIVFIVFCNWVTPAIQCPKVKSDVMKEFFFFLVDCKDKNIHCHGMYMTSVVFCMIKIEGKLSRSLFHSLTSMTLYFKLVHKATIPSWLSGTLPCRTEPALTVVLIPCLWLALLMTSCAALLNINSVPPVLPEHIFHQLSTCKNTITSNKSLEEAEILFKTGYLTCKCWS